MIMKQNIWAPRTGIFGSLLDLTCSHFWALEARLGFAWLLLETVRYRNWNMDYRMIRFGVEGGQGPSLEPEMAAALSSTNAGLVSVLVRRSDGNAVSSSRHVEHGADGRGLGGVRAGRAARGHHRH